MGRDPAVLFYTSDFISGTLLFSDEQRGQYIKLLCEQHQLYPDCIPENHMISVCGSIDSPVIKKFITDKEGNYYNKRMLFEIERRVNFCKSRSNNKSGRKKKKSYDKSYENHMSLHMENENENENKDKSGIKKKKVESQKNVVPPLLEWVRKYCKERGNDIDPKKFMDHYTTRDWIPRGYTRRMKDWQSAVRTWEPKGFKVRADRKAERLPVVPLEDQATPEEVKQAFSDINSLADKLSIGR